MMYGKQQEKEIETIKERTLKVNLSDADCERLAIMAAKVDLSVDELITEFIGDLVDGTYTNGSDEVRCAEDWFERSFMFGSSNNTFLKYLIDISAIDEVIENYQDIKDAESDIAFTQKELNDKNNDGWKDIITKIDGEIKNVYKSRSEWEEAEKEYIEQHKYFIKSCQENIKEHWEAFLQENCFGEQPRLEKEMENILKWKQQMSIFKGEKETTDDSNVENTVNKTDMGFTLDEVIAEAERNAVYWQDEDMEIGG